MLRDGAVYEQFPKQVSEELGDILWYVATVATKFGLDLDQIAEDNLRKVEDRWHEPGTKPALYDEKCPPVQRLPRTFSYRFDHESDGGVEKLVLLDQGTGKQLGNSLTDNAYEDDGYRYHDVMHLAFAARLGWSPVHRKLLRSGGSVQNRDKAVADAEDGGRAQVIEEAIVAAAYVYADKHAFLEGVEAVDWQLLRHIQQMTANLEVKDRTSWEWNGALIVGFKVWRKLIENKGGVVSGNLETGELKYSAPA